MNEEDKRESQVNAQMKQLNGTLNKMIVGINKLEENLGSVLSDQAPTEECEKDGVELVSLAARIRISRRGIDRIADQVYSIIDRLEL